ncbi:MAG TPA: phage baseplate assembly protein V [Thermoanaerobaculia bacterium]|jgi:phage baseplate assembly protein V|nr:phage baseplate assembly protein V [Thermoanaerobaculia bacterium]
MDSALWESLLGGFDRDPDRVFGVMTGIVTNNQDPDGLGRVKLRFPWLSKEHESNWARVISPMAGNGRGLYVLPEVDDEVLVAFEHGRVDFPFVLGSLWNGKDKPPGANDDGKNNVRALKSRSGHTISLDDTEGKEKIEIIDAKGKESIVLDTAQNTITITADKDIVIESKNGKVQITAKQGIEIKSQDGPASLEAGGNVDVKAGGNANVKGSTINLN